MCLRFSLYMGMQAGAAALEHRTEDPQKTKNRTTPRPSNCTTRHLSTGYRCAVSKGHTHPHVYSSTIDNSQRMERAQMSIDGRMDKEDVVYIYIYIYIYTIQYYSTINKNEILSFASILSHSISCILVFLIVALLCRCFLF